jgi:hypothetical protein
MTQGALAVSYPRVSTSAQADTDYSAEGYSIPAQREANQRMAERLDTFIIAEFAVGFTGVIIAVSRHSRSRRCPSRTGRSR